MVKVKTEIGEENSGRMEIPKIREKAKISLISTFLKKKLKRKIEAIKIITKITSKSFKFFWGGRFFSKFLPSSLLFFQISFLFLFFQSKFQLHLLPLEFLQKLHLPHFFELALIPLLKFVRQQKIQAIYNFSVCRN